MVNGDPFWNLHSTSALSFGVSSVSSCLYTNASPIYLQIMQNIPKCEGYKIQLSPDTKIKMQIWSRQTQAHKYMQMFKVLISFHQVLFYNRFKLWQMCTVLEWQK